MGSCYLPIDVRIILPQNLEKVHGNTQIAAILSGASVPLSNALEEENGRMVCHGRSWMYSLPAGHDDDIHHPVGLSLIRHESSLGLLFFWCTRHNMKHSTGFSSWNAVRSIYFMILVSNPGFNHNDSSSHQHRQGGLVTIVCSSLTLLGEVVVSNKVVFRETSFSLASYMGS